MRISCDPLDKPDVHVRAFDGKIFLDGIEMRGVITADTEKGYILIYRRDENRTIMINRFSKKPFAETVKLFGDVSVYFPGEDSIDVHCNERANPKGLR